VFGKRGEGGKNKDPESCLSNWRKENVSARPKEDGSYQTEKGKWKVKRRGTKFKGHEKREKGTF